MSLNRSEFAKRLTLEARSGIVNLCIDSPRGRQPIAGLWRSAQRISVGTSSGFGFTLHRNGGISLIGLPRTGGTSILCGASRERVRTLGKDHRAVELGPVGIYIGSDF